MGRRGFAALAVAALTAAWLWTAAGRPFAALSPGTAVTVMRLGYWQQARLPARDRAAVLAALRGLRARARTTATGSGPRYLFMAGRVQLVYDPARATVAAGTRSYELPPLADAALRQAAADAEAAFRGELVTWAEANRLFPLRADATVVDYATGLAFRVRRLAGSQHADVQPLTAADTAVLRRIYGGTWSWARRPVLVEVPGHRLAASMNGMPHGAGSIAGNDFPGHFCIHFLLSEVHRSDRIDPGHLLAVLQAAGIAVPPPTPAQPSDGC